MNPRLRSVINFGGFQGGWFACVLGAGHQMPWTGAAVGMLAVIAYVAMADRGGRARSLAALLLTTAVGYAADGSLVTLGALSFDPATPHLGLLPVWIVVLWALFGAALGDSLSWLSRHVVLGAVVGAVSGPLCYRAGVALGAQALPADRQAAFLWLALVWACAVPLAARWSERLRRPGTEGLCETTRGG